MPETLAMDARARSSTVTLPRPWLDDLVRYFYAKLGSYEDAQDAAIEAWHQGTAKAAKVMGSANPKAYFFGMARRVAADHLRKMARNKREPWATGSTAAAPTEDAAMVDEVLRGLSDDHREALVLAYVHGFNHVEIAQITRRSPAAVNSLLQRAREAFRTQGSHIVEDR
ncbi:MAG: RNA polymerase sigma factor [Armatimonadetes bacterium]|nr:RNA polymerase sigma factor [Armatimonadota bacterium]